MIEMGATLMRGAVIGFAIAAPVGPVGLLCIRRTFAHGPRTGLVSGLGAATADAMYGLIAALGVSAVAALLLEHAAMLRIVGGLLMAVLGVASLRRARTMPRQPAPVTNAVAATAPAAATVRGLFGAFGSTFALTASSPMTILSFAGLLAALAPPDGSMAGGLLLVGGVAASRKAVSARLLRIIEAVSGCALLAFATWSLVTGMRMA